MDIIEVQDTLHQVSALISFLGSITAEQTPTDEQKLGYFLCSEFTKNKLNSLIETLNHNA